MTNCSPVFKNHDLMLGMYIMLFQNNTILTAARCLYNYRKWVNHVMFCFNDFDAVTNRVKCKSSTHKIVPHKWCIRTEFIFNKDDVDGDEMLAKEYDYAFMSYDKVCKCDDFILPLAQSV